MPPLKHRHFQTHVHHVGIGVVYSHAPPGLYRAYRSTASLHTPSFHVRWESDVFTLNKRYFVKSLSSVRLSQACSLSLLHSCSLTSGGKVLKRSSSTMSPERFRRRHSDSSTGRPSRRFPRSSSCVRPVSSPNRDGSAVRQLFPRLSVRSFLHWKSSGGNISIWNREKDIYSNILVI